MSKNKLKVGEKMILTCTLNPSVDYVFTMNELKPGGLHRLNENDGQFFPGGKGINVSRVLKNLGHTSVATGFIAGFTGQYIETELNAKEILTNFIQLNGTTRLNIKMKTDEIETEINGSGPVVTRADLNALNNKLQQVNHGDYFILSGSKPESIPFEFYHSVLEMMQEKKIQVILDLPEKNLIELLKYHPFLIKPNHHELGEILNRKIITKADAIDGAKYLLEEGAKNVLVSMGSQGAVFVNQDMELHQPGLEGNLVSSVGAGDSMIAGFVYAYIETQSYEKAFTYGVASGTATAFSEGLCTEAKVIEVLNHLKEV